MIYSWIVNMSNNTGVNITAETAYFIGALQYIPCFRGVRILTFK